MKVKSTLKATFVGVAAVVAARTRTTFGPDGCVSVSRSAAGSCMLTTDCEGKDISRVEFAFLCEASANEGSQIVRHSFGVGGFDDSEDFDTEVKCAKCLAPWSAVEPEEAKNPVAAPRAPNLRAQPHLQTKPQVPQTKGAEPAKPVAFKLQQKTQMEPDEVDAVYYGPNDCVNTYKSPEGHCVIKTLCAPEDIANYEFGLVCVDKVGHPMRHMFGKNSFDAQETFDTLILCDRCLGLEDIPNTIAMRGQVTVISKVVNVLKEQMTNLTQSIARLNTAVFQPQPPPGLNPVQANTSFYANTNKQANLERSDDHVPLQAKEDEVSDDAEEEEEEDERPAPRPRHLRHSRHGLLARHHKHHRHQQHYSDDEDLQDEESRRPRRHHLRRREPQDDEDVVATDVQEDADDSNAESPRGDDEAVEDADASPASEETDENDEDVAVQQQDAQDDGEADDSDDSQ